MSADTAVLDRSPASSTVSSSNVVPPQVGSLSKEAPAISVGSAEIRPSGQEIKHDIDQELAGIGVKEKSDNPDLTFQHKEVGIEPAGPSTPVLTSSGKLVLPMSDKEIDEIFKTGQDDDSSKGLVKLFKKVIKAFSL